LTINILLVDDHRLVRDGLRGLIEGQDGLAVIGEAATGLEAVELAQKLKPRVVVMDVSMPDMNGIEATRHIKTASDQSKVVALSMHSDRRFVLEMLKVGASGYILKDCAFEEMSRAIRLVADNHTYLSPAITDMVIEAYMNQDNDDTPSVFSALTAREREVLQLLAEGNNTKHIAQLCHVSAKTIETHRQHIMEKLDIDNMAALTKYAVREGLTTLDT